jgi:hypothetical protein
MAHHHNHNMLHIATMNHIMDGVKTQLTNPTDTSPLLPPNKKKVIPQIVGTFLFYAQVIDMTVALSTLAFK